MTTPPHPGKPNALSNPGHDFPTSTHISYLQRTSSCTSTTRPTSATATIVQLHLSTTRPTSATATIVQLHLSTTRPTSATATIVQLHLSTTRPTSATATIVQLHLSTTRPTSATAIIVQLHLSTTRPTSATHNDRRAAPIYDSTNISYPQQSSNISYWHHLSSWRHKYYYHELYTALVSTTINCHLCFICYYAFVSFTVFDSHYLHALT